MSGGATGWTTVARAAELAGVSAWTMRRHLQRLHAEHGDVLHRNSDSPRAKLWVSVDALRRVMPGRFAMVSQLDLLDVHARIDAVEAKVDQIRDSMRSRKVGVGF